MGRVEGLCVRKHCVKIKHEGVGCEVRLVNKKF